MRKLPRSFAVLALSAAALAPGGCVVGALAVGAAATYGAIKYTENEATREFDVPMDRVWKATLAAMRDNGYAVADGAPQGVTEGRIESGDAKVVVQRLPREASLVKVRIGTFETDDNRRRATLILESITKHL